MKIYVYNDKLLSANLLNSLPESVSKQFVVQEVPNDAKIEDFINGLFTQEKYNTRLLKQKQDLYEELVAIELRKKYSLNQELAILRQRDTKPEEFAEYNRYAEYCKALAKIKTN